MQWIVDCVHAWTVIVMSCKNPITNSNPVNSHSRTWQYYPPLYMFVFLVVSFVENFPSKSLTLSSPIRATCSVHLFLLDVVIPTLYGEECKYGSPLYAVCTAAPDTEGLYLRPTHIPGFFSPELVTGMWLELPGSSVQVATSAVRRIKSSCVSSFAFMNRFILFLHITPCSQLKFSRRSIFRIKE
jgi:hypothetical protein